MINSKRSFFDWFLLIAGAFSFAIYSLTLLIKIQSINTFYYKVMVFFTGLILFFILIVNFAKWIEKKIYLAGEWKSVIRYLFLGLLLWPALGVIIYPKMMAIGNQLDLNVLGFLSIPFTTKMIHVQPDIYLFLLWLGFSLIGLWMLGMFLFIREYLENKKMTPHFSELFLIGFVFFFGLSLWTTFIHPVTGDEPHYLLMSHSIWHDGNIDLTNEMENKVYQKFYPVEQLDFHYPASTHGQLISKHLPLISLIGAPFYGLLGRFGFVLLILSAAALIAVLLSALMKAWGGTDEQVGLVWLITLFTVPVGIYFDLIFTELPAIALFLLGLSGYFQNNKKVKWLVLLAAIMLPWFYPKYIPLSAVLGFLMIEGSLKYKRQLLIMLGIVALSGIIYYWFYSSVYGAELKNNPYGNFHWTFSWRGIGNGLGLLIDRDFGLIPSSPMMLLAIAGVAQLKGMNKKALWIISSVFIMEFLLYMHFDDFTGSAAISSRHFLPASILLIPLVALGFDKFRKGFNWQQGLAWILVLLSAALVWVCSAWPILKYLAPKMKLWDKIGFVPSLFPGIADGMTSMEMICGMFMIIVLVGLMFKLCEQK